MALKSKFYNEDVKNIKEINFSIYTNDMVKKYSAVRNDPFGINIPDSYDNYEPKKGGLVDLRLGTCDIYLNCTTCGQNSMDCEGHFGHTELAEPVFHFGFLNHLITIMKCICLKCSNIIIERTEDNLKRFVNKSGKLRFREIKDMVKNINYCYVCGTGVPKIKKEVKETTASIRIVLEKEVGTSNMDEGTGNTIEGTRIVRDYLTPRMCYNILRNISNMDAHLLGFTPGEARPEDLIMTRFPIPPVIIRPTAKIDFMASSTHEDSLTLKIADIINSNIRVRNEMNKDSAGVTDAITLLQYNVATFFDNDSASLPKSEFKTGGRVINSISDRIKSKEGRMRLNIMGKRVDYSARSVITSDPYIDIDMVGIPLRVAKDLTIPEKVSPMNIKHLTYLVMNGRDIYPGANYVYKNTLINGKTISQRIDLRYRKANIKLQYGDIVERHVVNNDYVLFNRQPTLHKPSMMGHRVHVLERDDSNTLRMNVSVCKPYNADFDGDEMNIHLAQSIQAQNELEMIANVKYQIISAKDSNPIIGCVQDSLSGAYMLSLDDNIPYDIASNLLCNTNSTTKQELEKNKTVTGKHIFSHIIPKGINSTVKKGGNIIFQIKNGELLEGLLDKSQLSTKKNSIIHYIWDKYGANHTQHFIDDTQRLVLNYLLNKGLTVSLGDAFIPDNVTVEIQEILHTKIISANHRLTQFENDNDKITPEVGEEIMNMDLNTISSNVGKMIMDIIDKNNGFNILIASGAKGSALNVTQIAGCLGQVTIEGLRIKKRMTGRTLPIFHQNDDTPDARGFVVSSLLNGLKGHEFFFHTMGGREGLIDTAIRTAETGYLQRKCVKFLEDLMVNYEGIVRTANGILVQYLYGESGINQQKQTQVKINLINMNNDTIKNEFTFNEAEKHNLEKKFKIDIAKYNTTTYDTMIDMRNKLRTIYTKSTGNYKVMEDIFMLPINLLRVTQELVGTDEMAIDPNYIIERIDALLDSYDERFITVMKRTSKLFKEDDRAYKFLIKLALYEYISPKKCLIQYKLNKQQFDNLIEDIRVFITRSLVEPGEMVGVIAAQSIGEPTSQMSVTYDVKLRVISVSKTNGEIELKTVQIGDFCDEIISRHPTLTYNTGHVNSVETELAQLNYDYYIVGVDEKEKTHWNKISHVSRHPVNGNLMKVTTRSGRNVTTTLSHSHLIRKNNMVVPIAGAKLKLGMHIPVTKYIENIFVNDTVKINNINHKLDYSFGLYIGANLAKGDSTPQHVIDMMGTEICTHVPDFAFTAPNEFKAGLIQAFFDKKNALNFRSDGAKNEIHTYIQSEQLITDIALLLTYFDICSSITSQIVENKLIYCITLQNYIINWDKTLQTDVINMTYGRWVNESITRHTLNNDTTSKLLNQAINADVMWDEIVDIEIYTPNQNDYVYDFTVPGDQTFMINNGILVHNTLNTKHFAGVASKGLASSGLPRIKEIMSYSKSIKTPQTFVYFDNKYNTSKSDTNLIASFFKHLTIGELIETAEIYYCMEDKSELYETLMNDNVKNPFYINNAKDNIKTLPFVIRMKMNLDKMMDKETTLLDIKTKFITYWNKNFSNLKTVKKQHKDILVNVDRLAILNNNDNVIHIMFRLNEFNYNMLTQFLHIVLNVITLKGIDNIANVTQIQERRVVSNDAGDLIIEKEYVAITDGINMTGLKMLKGINHRRTHINDIQTVYKMYGIEAARYVIIHELVNTYEANGGSINHAHISLLVDTMTYSGDVVSIDRHGMNKVDNDPISKASFENTMDHFINAAIFRETDKLKSVSSRIAVGRVMNGGTGAFDLILDTERLKNSEYIENETGGRTNFISLTKEPLFEDIITYGFARNDFFIPN